MEQAFRVQSPHSIAAAVTSQTPEVPPLAASLLARPLQPKTVVEIPSTGRNVFQVMRGSLILFAHPSKELVR